MSDNEDPYAVSDDEDEPKGPPPKITFDRSTDLTQIKQSLANDENKVVKDEQTLKEIEELRQAKAQELQKMKQDFEEGKISTAEGVQLGKEDELRGLDQQTLSSFKNKFENICSEEVVRDEQTQKEIEELRQAKAQELQKMKQDFEQGKISTAEGVQIEKMDEIRGLNQSTLSSFKDRFENIGAIDANDEESRKNILNEEFAALKEERERAKKEYEAEQAEATAALATQQHEDDVQIAADHAQKMTAKWEKIHAKEAKKAEKSKMQQKT